MYSVYARSQFNDQIKNGHCLAIGVHGLHGVHVLQIEPWKCICLNCLCNLLIHPCCHWLCVYYENVLSSCTLSVSEVNKVVVLSLSWSKNYLHERKQKVVIRDSSSSLSNVSAGVWCIPRFCAWSLFLLIYVNDIGEQLLSLTRLFADDTSLGYSSPIHDTLELVINHDLNKLSIWSGKWPMSFNPDITEIMTCSNME
jgi:hypothetical protein